MTRSSFVHDRRSMPVIIDLTACSDTLLPFTQPPATSEITAVEVSDDDSEDDAILSRHTMLSSCPPLIRLRLLPSVYEHAAPYTSLNRCARRVSLFVCGYSLAYCVFLNSDHLSHTFGVGPRWGSPLFRGRKGPDPFPHSLERSTL